MAEHGSSAADTPGSRGSSSAASSAADRRIAALGPTLRRSLAGTGGYLKSLSASIADMKKEQLRMREEKTRATAELKKAQRRKQRLKTKVRQLTNEDLLAVVMLRHEQDAASNQGEEGDSSGGASSSADTLVPAPLASEE